MLGGHGSGVRERMKRNPDWVAQEDGPGSKEEGEKRMVEGKLS